MLKRKKMKNTKISKKKKSKPSQIYIGKIKDRNEHQKQNLLKHQNQNIKKLKILYLCPGAEQNPLKCHNTQKHLRVPTSFTSRCCP